MERETLEKMSKSQKAALKAAASALYYDEYKYFRHALWTVVSQLTQGNIDKYDESELKSLLSLLEPDLLK